MNPHKPYGIKLLWTSMDLIPSLITNRDEMDIKSSQKRGQETLTPMFIMTTEKEAKIYLQDDALSSKIERCPPPLSSLS